MAAFLVCPHVAERERQKVLMRTLIPSWGPRPHYLISQRPTSKYHHTGASTYEFEEGTQILNLWQDPNLEVQVKGIQVTWWTEHMTLSPRPRETPVNDIKGQQRHEPTGTNKIVEDRIAEVKSSKFQSWKADECTQQTRERWKLTPGSGEAMGQTILPAEPQKGSGAGGFRHL